MIKRVLIVDDDHALSRVLAAALGDEGFTVTTAPNGVEGLRSFDSAGEFAFPRRFGGTQTPIQNRAPRMKRP